MGKLGGNGGSSPSPSLFTKFYFILRSRAAASALFKRKVTQIVFPDALPGFFLFHCRKAPGQCQTTPLPPPPHFQILGDIFHVPFCGQLKGEEISACKQDGIRDSFKCMRKSNPNPLPPKPKRGGGRRNPPPFS